MGFAAQRGACVSLSLYPSHAHALSLEYINKIFKRGGGRETLYIIKSGGQKGSSYALPLVDNCNHNSKNHTLLGHITLEVLSPQQEEGFLLAQQLPSQ